ncbi:hypothetical protein [Frankia gtarii]|uniref:hypothetical protein n=1 Tax=Frankia gtarii TaxID=2950102 RepID=UPI0021BF6EC6|nr:hypothetical protein [Frankia gtarii]
MDRLDTVYVAFDDAGGGGFGETGEHGVTGGFAIALPSSHDGGRERGFGTIDTALSVRRPADASSLSTLQRPPDQD